MTVQSTISIGFGLVSRRILVSRDEAATAVLAKAFTERGWHEVEIEPQDIAGAALNIGMGPPPALIIVDIDGENDPLAALTLLAEACLAETRVLAIGSSNDIALFRALLGQGIADYLVKPLAQPIVAAALCSLETMAEDEPVAATSIGKVIAVLGARGGCGSTMLATSLAWAIAQGADSNARQCILVDFDLHYGSSALTFGVEPGSGLAAMLASPDRIDGQLIAANLQHVSQHGDALAIIASQAPIEADAPIAPAAAATLLAALQTTAPWIIADLPRGLDAANRHVLRIADVVVLVTPPTLEGLRDCARLFGWLLALRAGSSPLVVVNGADNDGVDRRLFENTIGQAVTAWLPVLSGPATAAAAHGVPLAALAGGSGNNPFLTLASRITGRAAPSPPKRRWQWWRRS